MGFPSVARCEYIASTILANSPNLDESIYTVGLPADCSVADTILGVRYRTLPPPVPDTDRGK
jgi:hypothetical protein